MKIKYNISWCMLIVSCLTLSCKKFLEVDPPIDSLVQGTAFQNDEVATSAITGIYSKMALSGYASGSSSSITALCGLSADELIGYNASVTEFYANQLTDMTANVNSLYLGSYQTIYTANAVLEGLNAENGVSPSLRAQILGETYFIRGFSYFYLVNIFGPVPIQLTTDYRINRSAPRSSVTDVYDQIITDLKASEELLTDKYITVERVRPNLSAVQAMLARVYLYIGDWANAEKYASLVIAKTGTFNLVALDNIFLKNSSEAIWQLFPTANANTQEGNLFILQATPNFVSLRNTFALNAFETNDARKTAWVKSFANATGTYYYPFKYKIKSSTTVTEYSMILRLAEQFLIRAEARCQQNNLSNAIDDIDKIRNRAGISLIKNTNPNISKANLLIAIQNERRIEMFAEWGHRWFDLKRTNHADAILKPLKTQWEVTDVLYPIPYNETSRNPNISQNDGYGK